VLRLSELERSLTTSPALDRYWDLYASALRATGRSFAHNERWIGIVPHLGRLLHEAGFQHIQNRAYAPLVAHWSEDFERWRQHFKVIADLLEPFFITSGVTARGEYADLRRQIDIETLLEDFSELPLFFTVWGEKPLRTKAA
jgi:hypothetical protein